MTGSPAAVTAVEVYGYDLSYRHGRYTMSGGRVVDSLASTVVRVVTAGGAEGVGEICPLGPTYLPGFAGGARAALAELGPALLGVEVTNPAAVQAAMHAALAGHPYAKSGVDIACWDAFGSIAGVPVAALLGGVASPGFELYVAVPLAEPDAMVGHVEAALAEGIHRFQLKVGGAVGEDLRRVRAVLAAVGERETVVADANGGWGQLDARRAMEALAPDPRLLVEQPCRTMEACAAVAAGRRHPLLLDEVIVDVPALLRAHRLGALDGFNLKVGRVGGLTPARRLRDLAAALGLSVTVEDTWGGDVTTAAVSHLAASTPPGTLLNVSFMNDWTNEHVAGYRPRSRAGMGAVPDGPGLGIAVDLAALGRPLWQART